MFLYLIVLTFTMRLKSTNYKSHWNVLIFYDQWKITSDLNMSHGKMPDFVWSSLFGFMIVIKLRNFDFRSHWDTLICFYKKRVRFEYVPWKNVWFCFIYIVWVHFIHKIENFRCLKYWNTLINFDKKDMVSDLNMSYGKMSDFVLFPLFWSSLVIKRRKSDFESHWNTLIYFDIKINMLSDLNLPHGKMSDFVSFPLFRFTLVVKLRKVDYEGH